MAINSKNDRRQTPVNSTPTRLPREVRSELENLILAGMSTRWLQRHFAARGFVMTAWAIEKFAQRVLKNAGKSRRPGRPSVESASDEASATAGAAGGIISITVSIQMNGADAADRVAESLGRLLAIGGGQQ